MYSKRQNALLLATYQDTVYEFPNVATNWSGVSVSSLKNSGLLGSTLGWFHCSSIRVLWNLISMVLRQLTLYFLFSCSIASSPNVLITMYGTNNKDLHMQCNYISSFGVQVKAVTITNNFNVAISLKLQIRRKNVRKPLELQDNMHLHGWIEYITWNELPKFYSVQKTARRPVAYYTHTNTHYP
jgi:hypothetical protein